MPAPSSRVGTFTGLQQGNYCGVIQSFISRVNRAIFATYHAAPSDEDLPPAQISPHAILVERRSGGDYNVDGSVDAGDYGDLATVVGQTVAAAYSGPTAMAT